MKARRFHLIQLLLTAIVLLLALAACAAPTSAPPAPTNAPAANTAAPTAAPKSQANIQFVFATASEPEYLTPKNACGRYMDYVSLAVYDHLTYRDEQGQIVGQLADSFERVQPTTWRFKLHKGIKFSNGEDFNADAVITAINDLADPAAPGNCLGEFGGGTLLPGPKKVDDYTVDVLTSAPDPILPTRLIRFPIAAPGWLKSVSKEDQATKPVGSGPYVLVEWQKGDHILLRAKDNYWGTKKAKINEIKIIPRAEAAVRASMVQAGEAQFAFVITPELVKLVPKTLLEDSPEVIALRINNEHPQLKDVRVRQAIAYSIDVQSIMKNMYPTIGGNTNSLPIRPAVVGYNSNLKPYPYDPEKAKKLLQEAGAIGTPLALILRQEFAGVTELAEAIVNQMNNVGFKASMQVLDANAWRDYLYAVKPGQKRADILGPGSWGNSLLDSSRVLQARYTCDSSSSTVCYPEFDKKISAAGQLEGDARAKAYQAIWAEAYDQAYNIGLFAIADLHGAAANVQWTPRKDGMVYFVDMSLSDSVK